MRVMFVCVLVTYKTAPREQLDCISWESRQSVHLSIEFFELLQNYQTSHIIDSDRVFQEVERLIVCSINIFYFSGLDTALVKSNNPPPTPFFFGGGGCSFFFFFHTSPSKKPTNQPTNKQTNKN